jgi:hypothetical protein
MMNNPGQETQWSAAAGSMNVTLRVDQVTQ